MGGPRVTEEEARRRVETLHEGRVELKRYAGSVMAKSTFACNVNVDHGEWDATLANVTHSTNPSGCPACGYERMGAASSQRLKANRVTVEELQRIADAAGCNVNVLKVVWVPSGSLQRAGGLVSCRSCDREPWTARKSRIKSGNGCSDCNWTGSYNYKTVARQPDRWSKMTNLYLVRVHVEGVGPVLKYGQGKDERVSGHERAGAEVLERITVPLILATAAEEMIRYRFQPPKIDKSVWPLDSGRTETVRMCEVALDFIQTVFLSAFCKAKIAETSEDPDLLLGVEELVFTGSNDRAEARDLVTGCWKELGT